MLQIAICDDNRADGQMMKALLSESLQIMGEPGCCHIFQNGKALEYEVEDGQDFDLLFLDIELGDEDGFLLAKRLQSSLPALSVSAQKMPDTDAFGDSFGSCGGTETQRESVPAGRERAGSRENTVGSNHIYPAAGEIRLHCEGGRKPEQSTENIKKSVGGAAGGTIFSN